jgi:beta-lactamase superfamily II metal-dependent hydrolase
MRNVPATLCLFLTLVGGPLRAAKTLDIYFVDTEGGQATLLVAPSGQSLLVDTGFPGNGGRDALRIAAAAKAAGVKRIDYLLITHFHADHVGGVANLLQKLPVSNFLDHGPSVESNSYPEDYARAFAAGNPSKAQHKVVAPGDTIPVKGLNVTVVAAAGRNIQRKGEPNGHCAGVAPKPENDKTNSGENPQSSAILVQFGKFRFVDLGDLVWNRELSLVCPENVVGKVDVYLTTHHGGESPQGVWGMAPRVAIMNNGARKGGNPDAWRRVMGSPGLEDMWQLHFAMAGGREANAPDTMIANLDEQCQGEYLKVSASEDGSFTVENSRNKYTKSYKAR